MNDKELKQIYEFEKELKSHGVLISGSEFYINNNGKLGKHLPYPSVAILEEIWEKLILEEIWEKLK